MMFHTSPALCKFAYYIFWLNWLYFKLRISILYITLFELWVLFNPFLFYTHSRELHRVSSKMRIKKPKLNQQIPYGPGYKPNYIFDHYTQYWKTCRVNNNKKNGKKTLWTRQSMGKTDLSCMLQTSKLIWLKLLRLSCWICRKLTWWLFMKRRRRQPWYPLLGFSQLKSLWNKGQPKIMEKSQLTVFQIKNNIHN